MEGREPFLLKIHFVIGWTLYVQWQAGHTLVSNSVRVTSKENATNMHESESFHIERHRGWCCIWCLHRGISQILCSLPLSSEQTSHRGVADCTEAYMHQCYCTWLAKINQQSFSELPNSCCLSVALDFKPSGSKWKQKQIKSFLLAAGHCGLFSAVDLACLWWVIAVGHCLWGGHSVCVLGNMETCHPA